MDGLKFEVPDGEDWGNVCVHVDNFLFSKWSATLQGEFNVWLESLIGTLTREDM